MVSPPQRSYEKKTLPVKHNFQAAHEVLFARRKAAFEAGF
jgi:hypothetical protein